MGTTAQKLQAIANSKAAIKSALVAKGVSSVGDVLSNYPSYIASLPPVPPSEITITGSVTAYQHYMEYGAKGTTAGAWDATTHMANQNLETLDLTGVTDIALNAFGYSCVNCPNLRTIKFPTNATYSNNSFLYTFRGTSPTGTITLDYSNGDMANSAFTSAFNSTGGNFSFHLTLPETIPDVTTATFGSMFVNSTGIKKITVSGLKNHLMKQNTAGGFGATTTYWTHGSTSLTEIEWPDLEVIGLETSQSYGRLQLMDITNTGIRTMSLPKLRELRFVGSQMSPSLIMGATYSNQCDFVTDWYFPSLTLIGRYGLNGITNTTFHFGAANKATIEGLPYYSTMFGATNSTAVFDL